MTLEMILELVDLILASIDWTRVESRYFMLDVDVQFQAVETPILAVRTMDAAGLQGDEILGILDELKLLHHNGNLCLPATKILGLHRNEILFFPVAKVLGRARAKIFCLTSATILVLPCVKILCFINAKINTFASLGMPLEIFQVGGHEIATFAFKPVLWIQVLRLVQRDVKVLDELANGDLLQGLQSVTSLDLGLFESGDYGSIPDDQTLQHPVGQEDLVLRLKVSLGPNPIRGCKSASRPVAPEPDVHAVRVVDVPVQPLLVRIGELTMRTGDVNLGLLGDWFRIRDLQFLQVITE